MLLTSSLHFLLSFSQLVMIPFFQLLRTKTQESLLTPLYPNPHLIGQQILLALLSKYSPHFFCIVAPLLQSQFKSLSLLYCIIVMLQAGGPLPGPKSGLLSNTRKWIVQGDTRADKARDFIGKGRPGGEQQGKGTQENCSATWLAVSGFTVIGLVSGLSPANHSDPRSFLVAWASLSQDGFQWEGFWEVGRTSGLESPLSFWPFPNSSGWW